MPPSTDSTANISTAASRPNGLPAFDDRPDDVFALVAGLTAALVVAPLVTAAVARLVTDAAVLYLTLLAGIVVVTTVGTLAVRRTRGLPERLGETRARWLLALVGPAVVASAALVAFAVGTAASADPLLGIVAGFGGFAGGGILGIMARSRYTKAVVEESETHATWRAAWSKQRRRPIQALGVAFVVGGAVALGAAFVFHVELLRVVGQLLVPLGAVVAGFGQDRTYTATTAGLAKRMPAAHTIRDWDAYEGYTVADDAIVVHYRAPWRLPVIFDRADLEDEDAVVAALDRHLHRLPTL